jgi:hypothetical protein
MPTLKREYQLGENIPLKRKGSTAKVNFSSIAYGSAHISFAVEYDRGYHFITPPAEYKELASNWAKTQRLYESVSKEIAKKYDHLSFNETIMIIEREPAVGRVREQLEKISADVLSYIDRLEQEIKPMFKDYDKVSFTGKSMIFDFGN